MRAWFTVGILCLLAQAVGCGDDAVPAPNCDASGHACTWLGMPGEEGFNGDGHDRLDTKLYWAFDLLFAKDGTPWFIDWNNHLVRRVRPDGTVQTMLGWTDPIFPGDGAADERSDNGALGTEVQLNHPTDLAELADGTLLVMAWHNHKLRKVNPVTGRVHIVCGGGAGFAGDGGATAAILFKQPKALVVDEGGQSFILDQQNFRIRALGADGVIHTIAGSSSAGFEGDGGPAASAKFGFEAGSNPEPSGGLALAGRTLFIADTLNNRIRAMDLDTGIIDTIAGTGDEGASGDSGPALAAQLAHPRDLEVGPEGDLYIADTDNSRIRAIDLATGVIRTVAGTGELGLDHKEGVPATELRLRRPFGLEFDAAGNLYIADTLNSRVLKVAR